MWLSIALTYCGICWIIGYGFTRTRCWAEATAESTSRRWLAVIEGGVVLLAPLAVPAGLVLVGKYAFALLGELRRLKRASRTFRAYEFVKVNSLHLDES